MGRPWREFCLIDLGAPGERGHAAEFMSEIRQKDGIDFGDTRPEVNDLLQQGVSLARHDKAAADAKFREALALDPSTLATYFCLYKIHAYAARLDDALEIAEAGLAEAVRQAGLPRDWSCWTPKDLAQAAQAPARFALYTLKAIAFIELKRGARRETEKRLDKLAELGASEGIGGGVVADLTRAVS
jgi:hypothetical protein